MRPGVEVQRVAHPLGRQVGGDRDLRDLALGVDAGIRAAGCHRNGYDAAVQPRRRFLQHRLDREAVILPLPADKGCAVVLKGEGIAPQRHSSTVPGGSP